RSRVLPFRREGAGRGRTRWACAQRARQACRRRAHRLHEEARRMAGRRHAHSRSLDLCLRQAEPAAQRSILRSLCLGAYPSPLSAASVSANNARTFKDPELQKRLPAAPDAAHGHDWLEMAKKILKKLVDSGVKVGFGTDTGPPQRIQGYFEHWEMELMAESGLTPQQIIAMATKNSAEFLGAKDLGTLQKGNWADLIVLRSNPLENIKNTRAIEAVWIAGNKVK